MAAMRTAIRIVRTLVVQLSRTLPFVSRIEVLIALQAPIQSGFWWSHGACVSERANHARESWNTSRSTAAAAAHGRCPSLRIVWGVASVHVATLVADRPDASLHARHTSHVHVGAETHAHRSGNHGVHHVWHARRWCETHWQMLVQLEVARGASGHAAAKWEVSVGVRVASARSDMRRIHDIGVDQLNVRAHSLVEFRVPLLHVLAPEVDPFEQFRTLWNLAAVLVGVFL